MLGIYTETFGCRMVRPAERSRVMGPVEEVVNGEVIGFGAKE